MRCWGAHIRMALDFFGIWLCMQVGRLILGAMVLVVPVLTILAIVEDREAQRQAEIYQDERDRALEWAKFQVRASLDPNYLERLRRE